MRLGILRLAGLALLMGVVAVAIRFPLHGAVVLAGLGLLAFLQWRIAGAWVFAFPIILAGVNLMPWTGWMAFGVLDMTLGLTLFIELFRRHHAIEQTQRRLPITAFALFGLSMIVAAIVSLWPFTPPTLNSFFDYLDPYNSLRILKGLGWAIIVTWMARRASARGVDVPTYFFRGMAVALIVVATVALLERYVYADIFPFLRSYRVVGPFASMHVGGSHIGAFIVFALPTAFVLMLREQTRAGKLMAGAAVLLGGIALLLTFSRAGWLGSGVGIGIAIILLVLSGRPAGTRVHPARRLSRILIPAAIVGVISYVAIVVSQGGFVHQRIAAIPADLLKRLSISADAIRMMDRGVLPHLTGMGLGSYPRYYYQRNKNQIRPNRRLIIDEFGARYLRFLGGRNGPRGGIESRFTVGQRVSLKPHQTYRFSFRARSSTPRGLRFEIKEKTTLNHRGGIALSSPKDLSDRWRHYEMAFSSGQFGTTSSLFDRGLTLLFFNSAENSVIDIDDIKLTDRTGRNLIRNGDFSAGHDNWAFEAPNHVAYQVKNAYIGLYFEQGLLGPLSFILLFLTAFIMFQNTPTFVAGFGSLMGFAIFSLFDNVLVAPKLLLLFLFYWSLICLVPDKTNPIPSDTGHRS